MQSMVIVQLDTNHAMQENIVETVTPMTRMKSIAHTFRPQGNRKMMLVVNGNGKAEKMMIQGGIMEIQIDGKTYTELTRWVDQDGIEHIEFIPLDDFIKWNETHQILR